MRVALTAGFDRALHVVVLAEALLRRGHRIVSVIVVTPFDRARIRAMARQRGMGFVLRSAGRVFGRTAGAASDRDELRRLAAAAGIRTPSLRAFCRTHDVRRVVVRDLNDPAAVAALRSSAPDVVAYGGGGILRREFLAAAGRVLNPHSGPLPEIRGMNACEWSLLLGLPTVVTIHWIDEGIDTGPPVAVIPVEVRREDTVETLRSRCVAYGVRGMVEALDRLDARTPAAPTAAARHRQCFVLAPVLREILDARLAARTSEAP